MVRHHHIVGVAQQPKRVARRANPQIDTARAIVARMPDLIAKANRAGLWVVGTMMVAASDAARDVIERGGV